MGLKIEKQITDTFTISLISGKLYKVRRSDWAIGDILEIMIVIVHMVQEKRTI